MRRALLAALAAAGAATAADLDAQRPPLRVSVGYAGFSADTRAETSPRGWALGGDVRLPWRALPGTSHLDGDWRAANGSAGRLDAVSAMAVQRIAAGPDGVYLGGGAGLQVQHYAAGEGDGARPAGDGLGVVPAGKLLAGYAWPRTGGLVLEVAWFIAPPVHGVRSDGLVASIGWRFDPSRPWEPR